jgi:N-acetyl-gamma-glutamyl-phosphate reductase
MTQIRIMKVGILGATGFTGEKLVEILLNHPKVEISYLSSRTPKPVPYSKLFPKFKGKVDLKCEPLDIDKAKAESDILFLSLPHRVSMYYVPFILKGNKKVIDLSADYRLKDTTLYKKYYGVSHTDKTNLKKAVYGLPELFKDKIIDAQLIANPGCYPTSIILALFPLVKEGLIESKIIADSKSAITGAGRKAVIDFHYANVSDNIWAYKPFIHQHMPEVVEILADKTSKEIELKFVPQVVGVEAGIYSTIYVSFKKKVSVKKIKAVYEKYYKDCPFIRLRDDLPKLKNVTGTNFCDLGFALDQDLKNGVVVSCIDNLIKGAAGAAVQNMNVMLGWEETLGLI